MTETTSIKAADRLAPVLPLRDVVVYPHMAIPLFVGREKSIKALQSAMQDDKRILLIAQKTADMDDPAEKDLYTVGTLASILQLLKLPDGTVKVLVEGVERAKVLRFDSSGPFMAAECQALPADETSSEGRETDALIRSTLALFEQYVKLNKKVPAELLPSLASMDTPGRLADTIAAHLALKLEDKQQILEIADARKRLENILGRLEGEIDILQIEKKIRGRVKQQMEKSQREYYLNEQMKAIQKELGEIDDETPNEFEDLKKKIEKAGMPKEALKKATGELNKLKLMSPMSAEATVVRNYLDWMTQVPWKKRTKTRIDLESCQKKLDEDHYGLEKVKERIVEYLAVQSRVKKLKGPILCLVGPPGVGKTSLGRSIAASVNRKFTRMSLGGVRDEAEIRGHRRTYIGSLPGKIIQNLAKSAVKNPLFLLDEIDKMSMDFRGDPSSALLEVLDPEQNHTFSDHYLEVDVDLSDVMFIATSNTLNIPAPLLDRMEVIRIPGYTEDEKLAIAAPVSDPQATDKQRRQTRRTRDCRQRAARHHPDLYPRSGRAKPRTPYLQDRAQGGQGSVAQAARQGLESHGQESREIPGRPAIPLWPRRGKKSGRSGHRPGMDRSRRRPADNRGRAGAGQGQTHAYRQPRRRHAGIHPGGAHRGACARQAARH